MSQTQQQCVDEKATRLSGQYATYLQKIKFDFSRVCKNMPEALEGQLAGMSSYSLASLQIKNQQSHTRNY